MIKDAEAHADQDKAEREKVDVRNNADHLISQTEKTLKELGDRISEADKAGVQSAMDELREKLKGDDTDAIKAATENLMKASHKIAEEMYKSTQSANADAAGAQDTQAGDSTASNGGDKKDGAVDADYEVVDDDK
jgi:molecular chaperone DnaK